MLNRLNTKLTEIARWIRILRKQALRPMHPGGEGAVAMESTLSARLIHPDGTVDDIGIISTKVVTTAFVDYLVQGLLANTTDVSVFKYHDCGTGTTAEATTDTALGTPYGGARAVGTQVLGASSNIYQTVGTISFTGTFAITEHGVFSASTVGTLCDRSVFAAINVVSGDAIEFTYNLTLPAGG